MRVNVYAEEMTDRIEIIGKEIDGHRFTGLRFYLELPCTVNTVEGQPQNVSGPFIHRPGDDDSAAVTFWGKRDLRALLRKALEMLDAHYGPNPFPDEAEPQESALRSALDRTGIALIASTNSGDGHNWVTELLDPEEPKIVWCAWCGRHMSEVEDWAECPPCDAFVAVRRVLSPAQDEREEKR